MRKHLANCLFALLWSQLSLGIATPGKIKNAMKEGVGIKIAPNILYQIKHQKGTYKIVVPFCLSKKIIFPKLNPMRRFRMPLLSLLGSELFAVDPKNINKAVLIKILEPEDSSGSEEEDEDEEDEEESLEEEGGLSKLKISEELEMYYDNVELPANRTNPEKPSLLFVQRNGEFYFIGMCSERTYKSEKNLFEFYLINKKLNERIDSTIAKHLLGIDQKLPLSKPLETEDVSEDD